MHLVLNTVQLAKNIKEIDISAPEVAKHAKAGQFVILRVDDKGERIPLTLFDWDSKEGIIKLVFLEVGTSTKKLGELKEGDEVRDILGPLGNPFPLKKYGRVACIGGGVGIAALYPIAKALRKEGNEIFSIIGARSSDFLILEKEMRSLAHELIVYTDDGSYGKRGVVSDGVTSLLPYLNLVVAVGPVPMMRAIAELTKGKVPCIASLNPIMVDGTGMCGSCRVMVGGKVKFACVDGPDFNAHEVDFEDLALRNRRYVEEEALSLNYFMQKCQKHQ